MVKEVTGYLYLGKVIVMNKSDIKNVKDEDLRPIVVYIDEEYIRNWAKELKLMDEREE